MLKVTNKNIHKIDKVIDNLFISSFETATNKDILKKYNIKSILNCAKELDSNLTENYYKYELVDELDYNINKDELLSAIEFIDNAVKNKTNILVHCKKGVSRSCTVVIAYFIIKHKKSYSEAYSIVKKARICCNPNKSFLNFLSIFHQD